MVVGKRLVLTRAFCVWIPSAGGTDLCSCLSFRESFSSTITEIGLKGRNRSTFEMRLLKNLEKMLDSYPVVTIHRIAGRLLVFLTEGTSYDTAMSCADAIVGVPGVARVSCGYKCERDMTVMSEAAKIALSEAHDFSSFKVSARRNHTDFDVDSMTMNREIGAVLCEAFPDKAREDERP